jgi:hypothetical protein
MFELGFDKQAAEKLDFSFLYEDDDEEYLIGIDERSYALLTIILFCKKRNYGIVVGSFCVRKMPNGLISSKAF